MSRLRMGSISNVFSSRSTEPRDGLLGVTNNSNNDGSGSATRPANNRSQSALLPLQHINTDLSDEAGPPTATPPVQGLASPNGTGEATRARNRAHTVSVAFASGRRGSETNVRRGRRRSSVSSHRIMEEGRASQASDRQGSGVNFELGDSNRDLDDNTVGLLDCIDPEVSTVNHLQNMTNSIVIPHFPALWSRRPEIVIPESPTSESDDEPLVQAERDDQVPPMRETGRRRATTTGSGPRSRSSTVSRLYPPTQHQHQVDGMGNLKPTRISSNDNDAASIKSNDELDSHVRRVLESSKRAKIKRGLRGFWAFVKTPMGAFTAIYGFLCAFWGAAIVLFLLGWIPTSSKDTQDKWVEISSQVCNGLFTITGVGLIPWRVVDTYRISIIWTLKRRTERLRIKRNLPPIEDPNDIPDPAKAKDYVSVLSERDQQRLIYQQEKFSASQTWYKPHATATHRAFPMAWALWNTILMDGNSFFQCILCGCMWGMNRHQRPAWTTGSLIPLSFLCGIGAGILIWQGSVRTKKTISVEEKLRDALKLPMAISAPRTQDGTVIAGHNKSPLPKKSKVPKNQDPTSDRRSSDGGGDGDDDVETDESVKKYDDRLEGSTTLDPLSVSPPTLPVAPRRTSVTFGTSGEKVVEDRQRPASITAPGHTPPSLDQHIKLGPALAQIKSEREEKE